MKSLIFGIGHDYEKGKWLIEDEIVGYIDNNLAGKIMQDGQKVISLSDINRIKFDRIIITSSKYYIEMLQQLEKMNPAYLYKTVFLFEMDRTIPFVKIFKEKLKDFNCTKKYEITDKYYIVIPYKSVTGGPELLHQLAFFLRNVIGNDRVFIAYDGLKNCELSDEKDRDKAVPIQYRKYVDGCNVVSVDEIEDKKENIIVIPEVLTKTALKIQNMRILFWWLSVDKFFNSVDTNIIPELFSKIDLHMCQSEYANSFLETINIPANKRFILSDYINDDYVCSDSTEKENIIAYNPLKGFNFSKVLFEEIKEYQFVPIEKMNNDQVKELLKRSKVYIDFGNHPGKDRLPREAALMNCCIVCAKRGSAKNEVDMPIDEIYKININENDWWINAKKIIDDCMCNYETHINYFDRYRLMVKNEKNMFNESVKKLVIYCNDRGDNNE